MAQHTLIVTGEKESPSISTPGSVEAGQKSVIFPFNSDKMTQPISRGASDQEGTDTMQAYHNWSKYRKELPELVATGEKNQLWIESALNDYRLSIIDLTYKLESVDTQVWQIYSEIREELPRLKKQTNRRPLMLFSVSHLEELWNAWHELIKKQNQHIELIADARETLRIHNTTQLMNRQLTEERSRQAAASKQIERARQLLETSLAQLSQDMAEYEPITLGSKILRLEDAQKEWEGRLEEFSELERSELSSPEEIIKKINRLDETVRDAPVSARWIRATETRYNKLLSSHELLVSLGKPLISQTEMAKAATLLYDVIPKLWLNGDNAELSRNLQSLERFLSLHEEAIKRELEFSEQRRPGITQALNANRLVEGNYNFETILILARSLVHAVDSRDRFMRGHSEEVARLAVQTARRLNWSGSDLEFLELAGLLHDVGKLSIPETVLAKTKPLTSSERDLIEKHPFYGANIVKPVKGLGRVVPWILHHQEHWDGAGYPDRLSRKDIPLGAGIIAVAEAYTVMTTEMPYRQAMNSRKALETLQQEAGRQFNPEVVDAFVDGVVSSTGPLNTDVSKKDRSST